MYADGFNLYVLYLMESMAICGVDLFMLISGYFMYQTKKTSLWKPVKLFSQVILFSIGWYLFSCFVLGQEFSVVSMIGRMIPANYFVVLYSVTYLLTPYINLLIDTLSERQFRKFVVVLVILFSICPTTVDILSELRGTYFNGLSTIGMYGSQWGYSIVNFMLMYIVGVFIRKEKRCLDKIQLWKLAVSWFACIVIMIIWSRVNDVIGYFTEKTAWEYCNPVVILSAVFIFLLFSRIPLGVNRVINKVSESVFTIYLLHSIFLGKLGIEAAVQENVIIMLLHMLISAFFVCCICFCVHLVYAFLTKPIYRVLEEKMKIPKISLEE